MLKYIIRDILAVLCYLPYGVIVGALMIIILKGINKHRIKKHQAPVPVAAKTCFFMYVTILLVITFLSRESGSRNGIDLHFFSTWGINERNNAYVIENILLFVPYGFLGAWAFPFVRSLIGCTFLGIMTSLGIEYLQMITERGFFQIDDILTNMLGAILGNGMFVVLWKLVQWRNGAKKKREHEMQ